MKQKQMFYWNSLAFSMIQWMFSNLISGSSAFSKSSLNTLKFSVHVLLKPHLENFEHYFASVWDEYNCAVIWTFFGIAFLWDWNENWPFPVLWPLLRFPNLLAYWVQHFDSIIFFFFFLELNEILFWKYGKSLRHFKHLNTCKTKVNVTWDKGIHKYVENYTMFL